MNVIAIRHVHFEDLGLLDTVLRKRGAQTRYLDAATDDLAPARDADLTIFLGGPISANQTGDYPFLCREIAIAQTRLARGQPTLGLCLGAQILARALGASVYRADAPEIGWAPVTLTADGAAGPLRHIAAQLVLHWHGETFELPAGTTRLASSDICPNQAFALGRHGLALQFHVEAGTTGIDPWLVGHALEIGQTPGVSVTGLRADTARHGASLIGPGTALFDSWLDNLR